MKQAISYKLMLALVVWLVAAAGANCWAMGGQHYPNGAEDFLTGALPPPGVYLINYTALVSKERLYDADGDKVPLAFHVDAFVDTARLVWSTPLTIFGGKANYAVQILVPWYYTNIDLGGEPGAGGAKYDDTGMGDVVLTPLAFGWHFGPSLHLVTAVDFIAPVGDYDAANPASQIISRNHWTIEPALAVTYLAGGFDFSAKFMYDFNLRNADYPVAPGRRGDLDPGQEFHFDWAIGYSPVPGLTVGLNGYQYWQTTEDEIDGARVADSDKGQIHGIGVAAKWWPETGKHSFTFKQVYEYGAKDRPEGATSWLKYAYAF